MLLSQKKNSEQTIKESICYNCKTLEARLQDQIRNKESEKDHNSINEKILQKELEAMRNRAETAEKQVELMTEKYANIHLESSSHINYLKREYEQLIVSHKDVKAERDLLKIENQVLQNVSAENRKFHSPFPQYTQNTQMTQNDKFEMGSVSPISMNSHVYYEKNKENVPQPQNLMHVINNATFGKSEFEQVNIIFKIF